MPKDFITERDIEDMVKRGILSLEINDQVVLTDLAYEKANRLGMRLVKQWDGFAEGVRPLLTTDNTGLNGLPMAFVALLSRATGDWVSRQLSFRLDSRPGLPE